MGCDNLVMNSTALFSMARGLQSPWQVNDISFAADVYGAIRYAIAPYDSDTIEG